MRLRRAIGEHQKVLAQVNGRPFIEVLIRGLELSGVRRIVLAAGYRSEEVREFVALRKRVPGSAQLIVSAESRPLGTGGAMARASRRTRGRTLIVMNGDSFAAVDFAAMLHDHRRTGALVTIAATWRRNTSRYGRLRIDRGDVVRRFLEKGRNGPGYINAGVYIVEKEALECIPQGRRVSWEIDVLPSLSERSMVRAFSRRFAFIDIGLPASWRAAGGFLEKAMR